MSQIFWLCSIGAIVLFIIGIYCVLMTSNLIKAVIGLEILTKAVTLFLILAGYVTGKTGLAQSFAITLIVIEVVVTAIAIGVALNVFRHNKSIDAKNLRNIEG